MGRCRIALMLLLLQGSMSSGSLAAVAIKGNDASRIQIDISDAPVVTILEDLRERFGFELEGTDRVKTQDVLSLRLRGSLKEVLGRLLKNWNYVIVSSESGEGVERVVILNDSHGAAPRTSPKADPNDPIKQMTGE